MITTEKILLFEGRRRLQPLTKGGGQGGGIGGTEDQAKEEDEWMVLKMIQTYPAGESQCKGEESEAWRTTTMPCRVAVISKPMFPFCFYLLLDTLQVRPGSSPVLQRVSWRSHTTTFSPALFTNLVLQRSHRPYICMPRCNSTQKHKCHTYLSVLLSRYSACRHCC